jgi:UDP-N-acetyl-D-glucosamine dehydrogenase
MYREVFERVVPASSPKVAEMATLCQSAFRNVNLAVANEFALLCRQMGVSSHEVIQAAASDPYGFLPSQPGPGTAGPARHDDPFYLAWRMQVDGCETRLVHLADEINRSMPARVVELVAETLNRWRRCLNGARVLALGVAARRGGGDTQESPALEVLARLDAQGADVSYVDPHVPAVEVRGSRRAAVDLTREALAAADCVVILTDHEEFDYEAVVQTAPLIVDTRGVTHGIPAAPGRVVAL